MDIYITVIMVFNSLLLVIFKKKDFYWFYFYTENSVRYVGNFWLGLELVTALYNHQYSCSMQPGLPWWIFIQTGCLATGYYKLQRPFLLLSASIWPSCSSSLPRRREPILLGVLAIAQYFNLIFYYPLLINNLLKENYPVCKKNIVYPNLIVALFILFLK